MLTGAESIARLCRQAGNRLDIMAGGGLQLTNLVEVVRRTGVRQLHGSLNRRDSGNGKAKHDSAHNGYITVNTLALLECDVRESVRLLHDEFKTSESLGRIVS